MTVGGTASPRPDPAHGRVAAGSGPADRPARAAAAACASSTARTVRRGARRDHRRSRCEVRRRSARPARTASRSRRGRSTRRSARAAPRPSGCGRRARPPSTSPGASTGRSPRTDAGGADAALAEAHRIAATTSPRTGRSGALGAALLPDRARVLTHCNAGALACVGYGTALGVVRAAAEAGKAPSVWVDETRPVLQGARLTAWELGRLGIPHTPRRRRRGRLAHGPGRGRRASSSAPTASRPTATWPTRSAPTRSRSLAAHHQVPFLVAAPSSTIDLATPSGDAIPVEERAADEVTTSPATGSRPPASTVLNLAFDVTPGRLVHAVVTERGIARRPYRRTLRALAP